MRSDASADKVKTSKADESYGRLTEIKVEKDVITSTLQVVNISVMNHFPRANCMYTGRTNEQSFTSIIQTFGGVR